MKLLVAACVLAPLLVVGARMVVEGRAAIDDAANVASDEQRIVHLGRAARRALPGGPAAEARRLLATLGRAGSLAAYEELRSAILATRWLATPDPQLLDEANHAIAAARGHELALLESTREPARFYSLLALAGLGLFVLGSGRGFMTARRGPSVALACVGLGAFVVGLWRA